MKIPCKERMENGNATLLLISEIVNRNQFLGLWEGSPSSSSIDRDEKGDLIHNFFGFTLYSITHKKMRNYNNILKEKLSIDELSPLESK